MIRIKTAAILLMFNMSTITVFAHQFILSTQVDISDIGTNEENLDSLGRTTPQGTVKGFFKSIGDGAYDQAVAQTVPAPF